jgi:hypothetical protein
MEGGRRRRIGSPELSSYPPKKSPMVTALHKVAFPGAEPEHAPHRLLACSRSLLQQRDTRGGEEGTVAMSTGGTAAAAAPALLLCITGSASPRLLLCMMQRQSRRVPSPSRSRHVMHGLLLLWGRGWPRMRHAGGVSA